jgi:hypothetical protein
MGSMIQFLKSRDSATGIDDSILAGKTAGEYVKTMLRFDALSIPFPSISISKRSPIHHPRFRQKDRANIVALGQRQNDSFGDTDCDSRQPCT